MGVGPLVGPVLADEAAGGHVLRAAVVHSVWVIVAGAAHKVCARFPPNAVFPSLYGLDRANVPCLPTPQARVPPPIKECPDR